MLKQGDSLPISQKFNCHFKQNKHSRPIAHCINPDHRPHKLIVSCFCFRDIPSPPREPARAAECSAAARLRSVPLREVQR